MNGQISKALVVATVATAFSCFGANEWFVNDNNCGKQGLNGRSEATTASAAPVKVSERFGFDPEDSTRCLQAALDSGEPEILIDRKAWVTRPLFARSSNQKILFEEGTVVLAKKGEYKDPNDALLTVVTATNVVLRGLGKGATLKMHIRDYQSKEYCFSEWRHALSLRGAERVLVQNMTFADSGGDGIYVGLDKARRSCRKIAVVDCVCDNNHRQGISVISVDGLRILRTVMKNTAGTDPKSGIDFEPNAPDEMVCDVVMRDCLTENNAGAGYDMYFGNFNETTRPVTITLENCRSVGDHRASLPVSLRKKEHLKGLPRGGFLKVRNCRFADCDSEAVLVEDKPLGMMDISFENCTFENCPRGNTTAPSVKFQTRVLDADPSDGVSFANTVIRRTTADGWFSVNMRPWIPVPVTGVTGEVQIETPAERKTVVLDEAWRKRTFSWPEERVPMNVVPFDPSTARVVDDAPGESAALTPVRLRHGCEAWLYAAKAGRVALTVRVSRVGRSGLYGEAFRVLDAGGRLVARLDAPTEEPGERSFVAPKPGFYRLFCRTGGHALVFTSCTAPIGFMPVPKRGIDLFEGEGRIWFHHAPKTDISFLCGGGHDEFVNAKLSDPAGHVVKDWRDLGEWGFLRIGPNDPAGLWSVEEGRPRRCWEDSFLDLRGAPTVFFLTDQKYFTSDKGKSDF